MGGQRCGVRARKTNQETRYRKQQQRQCEPHGQYRTDLRQKARDWLPRQFDTAFEPDREQQQDTQQVVNSRRDAQVRSSESGNDAQHEEPDHRVHQSVPKLRRPGSGFADFAFAARCRLAFSLVVAPLPPAGASSVAAHVRGGFVCV